MTNTAGVSCRNARPETPPIPNRPLPDNTRRQARERSRFVGRDAELRLLQQELEASLRGEGRLVWLVGEAGIGKTRLAVEVAHQAARRGAAVAWGRCAEVEGAPPYLPIVRALSAGVEEGLAGLAEIAEALRAGEAMLSSEPCPDRARLELFARVASALADAARTRPLVLLIEDLHWADPGSLRLLESLAREVATAPLLLVGTSRGGEDAAETLLTQRGRVVALEGLGRGAVGDLLEDRLGGAPTRSVLERVCEMTAGNPFFVIELAQLIAARESEGRALASIPPGVGEILRGRLRALPQPTLRLLEAASVLGCEFDLDPLGGVLDASTLQLLDRLEPAIASGLVREVPERLRRYAFPHALLREVLYQGLAPSERSALHGAVGEALEALGGARDERLPALAHHFFAAARVCDPGKAIRYGCEAGERALGLLAFEEAASHFERALAAAALGSDEVIRVRALSGLGAALHGSGERARADGVLREAVERARRAGPTALASAVLRLSEVRAELATLDVETNALLEEALDALPEEPTALRARVLARLSVGLHLQPGSNGRPRRLSDEAVAIARTLDDPATLGFVLVRRLIGLAGPDTLDERLATTDEILSAGSRTRLAELEALISRADDLAERGDRLGLDHTLSVFEKKTQTAGQPFFAWHLTTFRTAVALLEGRFEAAEALAVEGLAQGQRVVSISAPLQFAQQLFMLRGLQGRFAEVEPLLEQGVAETAVVPAWRCALAYYYQLAGRDAEARREYEALAVGDFDDVPRDTTWLTAMVLASCLCARLGDRERADVLYEKLRPYAGRIAIASPLVVLVGMIDLRLGVLASMLGRYAEADRHFADALALADRMRGLCWQCEVRYEWARHLTRRAARGDRERALGLLQAADDIARGVGMQLLVDWIAEARADVERLGLDVAVGAPVTSACDAPRPGGPVLSLVRPAASTPEDGDPAGPPPPRAGTGSFRREGGLWKLEFEGQASHFRDMVGLAHLSRLLRQPGREIHAVDLVSESRGSAPDAARAHAVGDGGELLDVQARREYETRLESAREELEEAERSADRGRVERLREEIEWIGAELSRAFGLGGRARRAGAAHERARLAVTRTIKYAIGKIACHDAALADHLRRSVRTGAYCAYEPSPRDHVSWRL